MKVVIFGASGMVGSGALLECLDDSRITTVLSVARSPGALSHPKLRQLPQQDFYDYTPIQRELADTDVCLFCLGVSAAGLSEAEYRRQTHDLTLAAARALLAVSPQLTFCYVSGQGTDSAGTSRMMWARVKGQTENDLLALPFKAAYMFRPGFIQPLRGVRSKTRLYQAFYNLLGPILPVLGPLLPRVVTTTVTLGRAMIEVGIHGYSKPVLETADINRAGKGAR